MPISEWNDAVNKDLRDHLDAIMGRAPPTYRVQICVTPLCTIEIPTNSEPRAMKWMHDFAATNPGKTAKVFDARGDVIAAETAGVL